LRTASRRGIDDDHRGFQHLGVGRKLVAFEDALPRLLSGSKAGILYNEHIAEDGAVVFARACNLDAEGILSKRVDAPYRSTVTSLEWLPGT
jgi:bifunctional non-homologous end joining protein LigD